MTNHTQQAQPEAVLSSAELEPGCICRSWCRSDLWSQIIDGHKYPMPNHANDCPAQKREPFAVLEYDGARCVMEPREADDMECIGLEGGVIYRRTTVMLTRDQFERMEEFAGF